MEMVPFGPPQSALPTAISMSPEQHERLGQPSLTGQTWILSRRFGIVGLLGGLQRQSKITA
jgi:hypothetical protein